jgi:hypothetical protein
MKKILSIIILSLLIGGNAYAECIKGDCTNGNGTFIHKFKVYDGSIAEKKYVGEFKNGKRNGQGTETDPYYGFIYVGEFKDDKKDGQGTISYPGVKKYVGGWKNDKEDGQGVYTYDYDGRKETGVWKDGKKYGQVNATWPDGGKYVGEWKDDKRNGQATLTHPDGEIHVSQWEDDKKIGKGSTTFPDGTVYAGSNNDLNFEYSESLSNKNLKTEQIHKICSEYENKNTNNMRFRYDFEWRVDKVKDLKRNISNHCTNAKVRTEFKKESKYNLVKDLDIEKLNFNYFTNKHFSMMIPDTEITKKTTCFINLKKEKQLDYLKIKEICGVKKIRTKEDKTIDLEDPYCSKNCNLVEFEYFKKYELSLNYLELTDYFYADANNDDYMDLIIRFKIKSHRSERAITQIAVVTSLTENNFSNINYEKKIKNEEKLLSNSELYSWIKNQTEHTNANELIHDRDNRFDDLILKGVPNIKLDSLVYDGEVLFADNLNRYFSSYLFNALGGPPDDIKYYENKRYVVTSACKGRECPIKGFVFFDTKDKYLIAVVKRYGAFTENRHKNGDFYIFSKTHKKFDDLPKIFFKSVHIWRENLELTPQRVFFTGSDALTAEVTKKFK